MNSFQTAYAEKLKDPRWQKKRLEIFERDQWACQKCFSTENTLSVHHRYYLRGKEPWDYPDDALITLCQFCHGEGPDLPAERSCLERIDFKEYLNTVKKEIIIERTIPALKEYRGLLEVELDREYDPETSQRLDCINYLLEAL